MRQSAARAPGKAHPDEIGRPQQLDVAHQLVPAVSDFNPQPGVDRSRGLFTRSDGGLAVAGYPTVLWGVLSWNFDTPHVFLTSMGEAAKPVIPVVDDEELLRLDAADLLDEHRFSVVEAESDHLGRRRGRPRFTLGPGLSVEPEARGRHPQLDCLTKLSGLLALHRGCRSAGG